ncbi:hypothetical protein BSZ36_10620 [Rubricoccus marinus]|uniref:RNA 2-O ribose methyltransferase substrate binding domain-containing protein n=1 Tax=Rubricoccus marinus TaxID=716817 RepID=A0A259U0P3_9BACT|nr:hypothetical protein BSZ36_10620 [Rubricoccus marinus]
MTRQRLKDLASLSSRKGRRQNGAFLVEGVRSVESAEAAGAPLAEVLVAHEAAETDRISLLISRLDARGVPVHRVAAKDMARVGDARTSQGVVGVARSIVAPLAPPDRRPGEAPAASRVLVLDGVQDPGNVGALVRTAAWFGVDAVLADANSADFEGPKAVRAAMGGLWDVRLSRVDDLGAALDALRARGLALWGAHAAPGSSVPLAEWAPRAPSALVMGSEGHGLSEASRQRLTGGVWIPGGGGEGAESLNVSVAAGILMHAWVQG